MESQERLVCLTENELNFQLLQIAEEHGLADEVSTDVNKAFIKQYTVLKHIPVDLASVIRIRYTAIHEEARTQWQAYMEILSRLTE